MKTLDNSLHLIGGIRAGVDRTYKAGIKEYKYSLADADLIIGIDKNNLDLYLLPVLFIAKLGKSIGKGKLTGLKNNWNLLLNWNSTYLDALKNELGFP